MIETFLDFPKKKLVSRRSLLFPMLVLAVGIHAALLIVPLPSAEEQKEPDSKKNPITVTQIPTEKPVVKTASASARKVTIPKVSRSTSSKLPRNQPAVADTSSSVLTAASTPAKSSSASRRNQQNTSVRKASENPVEPQVAQTPATVEQPANVSVTAESAPNTSLESAASQESTIEPPDDSLVANFPHFQPSEKDCYQLGFGENCRIVENGAIAQVVEFFQAELPAQDYTAQLITDEPAYKVLKVVKAEKTLFLNIWQSKQNVSYLLAGVIHKRSPEEISRNVTSN